MASLKELFTKHGLTHIEQKFMDADISIDTLKWLDMAKDFDALIIELDINNMDGIKLRSAINQLQSTKITTSKRMNRIQQICETLQTEINIKFNQIINELQHKQNELLLDIHRWKLDTIKNEQTQINAPKINFSSSIDLNDISSFADIQSEHKNNTKINENQSDVAIINNPLNPFCDNFIDTRQTEENTQQIHLKYTKHRKHFMNEDTNNLDQYHPKNLLDLYIDDRYYSDKFCNLEHEKDWIIFQSLHDNEYFIPMRLELKNHKNEYAVKKLCVYIGDGNDEWYTLHYEREHIIISNKNLFIQQFDLNLDTNVTAEYIVEHKLNCFKIELIENYGACAADKSKFCLHYFGLFGARIDDKSIDMVKL